MAIIIGNPAPADDQLITDFQASTGHPTIMVDCDATLNPDTYEAARDWVAKVMQRRTFMPVSLTPGLAAYEGWHANPGTRPPEMQNLNMRRLLWWQSYQGQMVTHTTDCVLVPFVPPTDD